MFCTQCGKQNPDGTKFCVECGAQLEAPVETPVEAPVKPAPQPVENTYQPEYQSIDYVAPAPQELPAKGLGITSMILGIVSVSLIVTFCCCYLTYGTLPFMLGLAAVITGAIAKSKAKAVGMKNGKATAGFICGLISVIIVVLFIVGIILLYALGMGATLMETTNDYNDYIYYFINGFKM